MAMRNGASAFWATADTSDGTAPGEVAVIAASHVELLALAPSGKTAQPGSV